MDPGIPVAVQKTKAPTDFLVERQETFGDMARRPAWPQVIKDKWGHGRQAAING